MVIISIYIFIHTFIMLEKSFTSSHSQVITYGEPERLTHQWEVVKRSLTFLCSTVVLPGLEAGESHPAGGCLLRCLSRAQIPYGCASSSGLGLPRLLRLLISGGWPRWRHP